MKGQDSKTSKPYAIDIADIHRAAAIIRPFVLRTAVVRAPVLDQQLKAELFFKCENHQHVGAFKARGACHAVFRLNAEQAAAGVVTHSSGNHAAALARAATLRGIDAHIVMPHNSSPVKLNAVRQFGVKPTLCEPTAEARQETADRVAAETGATFVHPYNDPWVMAGQGTAALELLEQVARLDAIVVPVGGGGLLSGTLVAVKALCPSIEVYAAEPAWADDAARSLKSGRREPPLRYDTIADGLRTPLGDLTFPIIRDLVKDVLLAEEADIRRATVQMARFARLTVEPSAAVPLAAIDAYREQFQGRRVGVVVSGGNLQPELLAQWLAEPA